MKDLARLKDSLGRPGMEWLVQRLRQRLENGLNLSGTVTLRDPAPAQRSALARLLGRRQPAASLVVKLDELDRLLRAAEICDGLDDALHTLVGPVPNIKQEKTHKAEQWQLVFDEARELLGSLPEAHAWFEDLKATGLLRRLANNDPAYARTLLNGAVRVIRRLPADGVPIAELAATCTGNSHALDAGEPVGTLVMRFISLLNAVEAAGDAEERRHALASAGILCDELSSPVLVLNLRSDSSSATGESLRLNCKAGEPYRLSTRQLLRDSMLFHPNTKLARVFVCENPTVVAAAANRLGSSCAPLVCVEGQPKTAARLLLGQLTEAGTELFYHGDFDWPGIQIANVVFRRHGFTPWRFTSRDYLDLRGSLPLTATPIDSTWDPELKTSMMATGRAIHEEQAIEILLGDLGASWLPHTQQ